LGQKGRKKTVTFPDGNLILDMNGEGDVVGENYGVWSEVGTDQDVLYHFSCLKLSQKMAMEVSLKTENEEGSAKTSQTRGSEGGRRGVTGTCKGGFYLASFPVALRPPHPWPKAGHGGVASSLFCF